MRAPRFTDNYGLTGFGFLSILLSLIVVVGVGTAAAIIFGGRAVGRTTCRHWSEQTGYRSKFVVLNFFDEGTCLALTPSGKWVLNSRVITFTERKP